MNIVRGCGPDGAAPTRAPHAPQKAKPTCTLLPQLGQAISPAGAGPPVVLTGAGVVDGWMFPAVARGAGVGPANGFGGSENGTGAGIFGESFQGIPPFGLGAVVPAELRSSPALTVAAIAAGMPPMGGGGRTVRAVSSGPSFPRPVLEAGAGAGRASSFPQPRQNL
jgi:hypothetical protein